MLRHPIFVSVGVPDTHQRETMCNRMLALKTDAPVANVAPQGSVTALHATPLLVSTSASQLRKKAILQLLCLRPPVEISVSARLRCDLSRLVPPELRRPKSNGHSPTVACATVFWANRWRDVARGVVRSSRQSWSVWKPTRR